MPTEPTYDVGLKGDYHAMWIDPNDTRHFYLVGDGGLYESWDMGETYERLNNIPIGQFYGIGLDDDTPYNIYGGMQDDHSWFGPSATRHYLGIAPGDWHEIGFNDGLEGDPDVAGGRHDVYSNAVDGDLTRVDSYTGDRADIHPQPPAGEPPYRWEWITPGLASRHTPGTYYYGGNKLFITHDDGRTWQATKDLTRDINRDTVHVAGVADADITLSRNDGQGAFSAISAIDESPASALVLWVGTDDGNVQVSRDGGKTWTEVSHNVHGVPDGSYVSSVLASSAGPGTAYVAFDNHRRGDFAPYLVKTTDFGRSWTSRAAGLPADGSARKIAEYPGHGSVLFLGTEHHFYLSTDGGTQWTPFGANLPTTLYLDAQVQRRTHDLVVATHGRSIWILDDAAPLAEWSNAVAAQAAHLFSIRPATIFQYWEDYSYRGQDFFAGDNPPDGAILDYSLAAAAPQARLTITDSAGHVVRTLEAPGSAGVVHRVVWDLRHTPPPETGPEPDYNQQALPRAPHPTAPQGPFVSPGRYTVTLTAGGATARGTVLVKPDPKMPITLAQYRAREAFLLDLLDVQRRSAALVQRAQGPLRGPARRLEVRAYGLASDFNGRGAVQGTLYPPTAVQRRELTALKRQLAGLEANR
jgi:BNR/Asp-box repeat